MGNIFTLNLHQHYTATAVRVDESAELFDALGEIGLLGSRPILVVVGGASQISEIDYWRIQDFFVEVLASIAQNLGAYVVDGGTDAGVMRLMGYAREQINGQFPLIGVAPIAKVLLPNQTATPDDDATPLEPHHTHFVLVPGNYWGAESPWIVEVATLLASGAPSLTVLINGGEISFSDALNSITAGRLVVAIAGSGRTADKLVSALHGETTDERAQTLAASGKLLTINLNEQRENITHILTNLLSTQE
jgi:hypothetical protein